MKHFDLHPEAVDEVSEALNYYQKRASAEVVNDLDTKINLALFEIERHPQRYPCWNRTQFRKYTLHRFPYLIFYVDYPDCIRVLAVAHTSRRPGYWKTRIAVD